MKLAGSAVDMSVCGELRLESETALLIGLALCRVEVYCTLTCWMMQGTLR